VRHAPWLIVVAAAVAGLGAGAGVRYAWIEPTAAPADRGEAVQSAAPDRGRVVGSQRPAFSLTDLEGNERAVGEWSGQVMLINFWATWCPPCRKEMPALAALNDALRGRGLRVIGVALDEAQAVRSFADERGIDYPLLIGGRDAYTLLRAFGNARGTLPYTVVVDRSGTIRATHRGALTRSQARELVLSYL
jgi:peroxiredoxin